VGYHELGLRVAHKVLLNVIFMVGLDRTTVGKSISRKLQDACWDVFVISNHVRSSLGQEALKFLSSGILASQ